ncbi:hypothetical protein J6590_033733 [Homalodisca vitripennis]|nr:hypothetical protein J6590_033733 [Homalodisca vitripennis]
MRVPYKRVKSIRQYSLRKPDRCQQQRGSRCSLAASSSLGRVSQLVWVPGRRQVLDWTCHTTQILPPDPVSLAASPTVPSGSYVPPFNTNLLIFYSTSDRHPISIRVARILRVGPECSLTKRH